MKRVTNLTNGSRLVLNAKFFYTVLDLIIRLILYFTILNSSNYYELHQEFILSKS